MALTDHANTPAVLFERPATALQTEQVALRDEVAKFAKAKNDRLADVQRSVEAVQAARAALAAEQARGAAAAQPDFDREAELALALDKAKAAATEEFHIPRVQAAQDAYTNALGAYEAFMREHLVELLEELRPEVEAVAAELEEAMATHIRPLQARLDGFRHHTSTIIGHQRIFRGRSVPMGHAAFHPSHFTEETLLEIPNAPHAPIPTADAVAAYRERSNPTREPVPTATD